MSLYMSGIILYHSYVIFIEAESLSQTYSSPIWLVPIASWLQRCHLHLLRLELQAGCLGIYMASGDLMYSLLACQQTL